jgi:multidrug efflux system outer membrane protein
VIDGERQVLISQLQASHLSGTQAVATVNLIRALGGGWGDVKPAGDEAVGAVAPASGAASSTSTSLAASASASASVDQVAKR